MQACTISRSIYRAPFLNICVLSTPQRLAHTEILNTQPLPWSGSDRLTTHGLWLICLFESVQVL